MTTLQKVRDRVAWDLMAFDLTRKRYWKEHGKPAAKIVGYVLLTASANAIMRKVIVGPDVKVMRVTDEQWHEMLGEAASRVDVTEKLMDEVIDQAA